VEHRYSQTFWRNVEDASLDELNAVLDRLAQEAGQTLAAEGFSKEEMELQYIVDMRYHGQSSELSVPAPRGPVTPRVVRSLVEAFHQEHEHSYGYRSDGEEVQYVNLRLRARGIPRDPVAPEALTLVAGGHRDRPTEGQQERQAYFGPEHGWKSTPIVSRGDLSSSPRVGPLIVEEYDSTVLVPPGATAALDEVNNIRIDVSSLL
jgi:N-methylhydantoinase A